MARTGFFRSDGPPTPGNPYYFIDPEDPLFSTANQFRYTDDPTMRAPVLERSNVGMGLLLSNAPYMDKKFVNCMYRKLRDLEVNSLKKFSAITPSDSNHTLDGINPRELLMVSEAIKMGHSEEAKSFWTKILHNHADLAIVLSDYFKPLVSSIRSTKNAATIFSSLPNTGAAYTNSTMEFDFLQYGMIPSGGLSFSLAQTPWFLGEFLSLTGRKISGQNILFSGLAKRWISPEAFSFMEVTSEHKLEVSEKDATGLISEHYLEPPKDWVLKPFIPVINDVFSSDSVDEIMKNLSQLSLNSSDQDIRSFAKECEERMRIMPSPLALQITNLLIKKSRKILTSTFNEIVEEQGNDTAQFIQNRKRLKQQYITKPSLIQSLTTEVRANINMMEKDGEISKNIYLKILGNQPPQEPFNNSELSRALDQAIEIVDTPIDEEFIYHDRSDFTLSAHPKLRKFHPDFNFKTGLDHDPLYMQKEVIRWSDTYLDTERDSLRSIVSGIPLQDLKRQEHLFSW